MKNKKIIMAVLLAVYWIGIFILTHMPIPKVVYKANVSDKTLHFVVYLILTFLFWQVVATDKKINWRKRTIWWVMPLLIAYGAIDEWLQQYVNRSADLSDFIANMSGVATGLILLSFLDFTSCFIVVTATSILAVSTVARGNLGELMPRLYSAFHLCGYGLFAQLIVWKLCEYKDKMKIIGIKWLALAYAFALVFLAVVIATAKLMGRYFELRNMMIAFAAILITISANIFVLWVKSRQKTKAKADNLKAF